MKKLPSIITAFAIVLLATSCNETGKANGSTAEATESTTDTLVAEENTVDTAASSAAEPSPESFRLEKVVDGLVAPIGIAHPNDGSNRLFVLEQPGRIRIIKDGKLLPEPFLNLESKMNKIGEGYTETGLLGLAFHPDYKNNGRFFVYYSAPSDKSGQDHQSVIAEYHVTPNPNKAGSDEKVLMVVQQPESNHNGGHMAFGPDGYLYIGIGDGGGAGDKHGPIGNAQDHTNLLGTIVRIDINSGNPYAIPADNPFLNNNNVKDEIWATGLRNPWRFSFDRQTGELFCGDVGQNKYEEVNIIEKGKNYGWRAMEGYHVYDQELLNQLDEDLSPPINEYDHSIGNSITGGYVYRGSQYPALNGKYIFGDWSGKIFYLEKAGNKWNRKECRFENFDSTKLDLLVSSFGEDEKGEIYVTTQAKIGPRSKTGTLYKIALVK